MKSLICLPLFLLALPIFGQDSLEVKEKNMWNHFTYDMGNVFGGIGHSYSRPLHWEGDDWANLGYMTAGTLLLFAVDGEINDWTQGFKEDVPDFIMDYGHKYGNPNNNYMITGGVYLTGLFTKNEKLRRTGVLLIASASAGGLLQQVSKRIVGRARPKAEVGHATFDPLHLDRVYNYDSFPSGHAMLAFSNAYVIAKQFDSPWIKGGLYAIGLVPGMVRVVDDFHWFSDVAFSTVLSIFIVESIDRYLDSKYDQKYGDPKKNVSWNLSFGPNRMGLSLHF
jgi:membrane-associated phospholipid phosphatase